MTPTDFQRLPSRELTRSLLPKPYSKGEVPAQLEIISNRIRAYRDSLRLLGLRDYQVGVSNVGVSNVSNVLKQGAASVIVDGARAARQP